MTMWLMLAILLLATAFRFGAPFDAPPGWRDDELIEFDMDVRIRDGWRPLYIVEAEGHEPLYHTIHAATIALFGENTISYRWLPMAFGVLTVTLTYALARRLFGANVAVVAAALMAVSFWPIMYARFGLRHIGVLPWMMGVYLVIASRVGGVSNRVGVVSSRVGVVSRRHPLGDWRQIGVWRRLLQLTVGGVCLAAGLMTYFAGRVVPAVVVAFGVYLLLFHRAAFKRAWVDILIVLAIGAALAAPMFIEINRLLPGGEQRLGVVAPQLVELRKGNLQPALETTLGTLGMFTFRGDPEALYNVEGRPVFDWLTGAFFYIGLAAALWRWRRVAYGFALIAFGLGIAPAFISNPPGSFSHTIAAMPLVYSLAGLGAVLAAERAARLRTELKRMAYSVVIALVTFNGVLTIQDYFGTWAQDGYVRFLYHAPTRRIAQWLDQTPDVKDVAIATHPNYLRLDPLALRLDLKRDDVRARWFDSGSVFAYPGDRGLVIGTTLNPTGEGLSTWAGCCTVMSPVEDGDGFVVWRREDDRIWDQLDDSLHGSFDARVTLLGVDFTPYRDGDRALAPDTLWLALAWRVEEAGLPPALNSFVHLADAEGNIISQFDGMGVYLPSLWPGDRFVQVVPLNRPAQTPLEGYSVRIGLYDSATHTRLRLPDRREFLTFDIP